MTQTEYPQTDLLSNLLALIIGDGGHYEEEHGTQKAFEAAADKVTALRSQRDAYYSWHSDQGREIIALRRKVDDLENELEAVKEERGDLLMLVGGIGKAIAHFLPVPFAEVDDKPLTREEAQGAGIA